MQKTGSALISLLFLVYSPPQVHARESTRDYSVQLSAQIQVSPPRITLTWVADAHPHSYRIYRKGPGDCSWSRCTMLPGSCTRFSDTNVSVGTPYEYQVIKLCSKYTGNGYIYSGINLPLTENRGRLLLVVDKTVAKPLEHELARLQQDLVGDGWQVTRIEVGRHDSVVRVKSLIKAEYLADPDHVKCVFLFGHVPVPYAGDIVPDGHVPFHRGAWACDGYYGDMDGLWTDDSVNVVCATDPRNRNVPGDGKFDQSSFPAPLKLMVGRVDLANMPGRLTAGGPPTFPSEVELLRHYLNKDHLFRTKQFDLPRRAVIGDYFGVRDGEAFAASAWRNFATFFGPTNVDVLPCERTWIPTLSTNAYLFAYGCGPGTFTSIEGLGNSNSYNDGVTTELVGNDIKSVFTILFGSWLGDWDSEDDLMRAVLATRSYGLASAWSGRPHWFLHHMAMGKPIGFSTRLTQNNGPGGLYQNQVNHGAGQIQIALMGDPTLRMHVVAPPSDVVVCTNEQGFDLAWAPSAEPVVGYYVYRGIDPNGLFTRVTPDLLAETHYLDASAHAPAVYMVRAVKLETSASGSYYNASEGAFATPIIGVPNSVASADAEKKHRSGG